MLRYDVLNLIGEFRETIVDVQAGDNCYGGYDEDKHEKRYHDGYEDDDGNYAREWVCGVQT